MSHLVIGAGEVGRALATVLDAPLRDITPTGPSQADVLHICIPYTPAAFADQVRAYAVSYGADLVVVHSTVPVGTCDPHGWVHSPVRGRHPDLAEGLRVFTKFFGGGRAADAAKAFADAGIDTRTTPLAATTESGKLWELTQFGLQVAVEKAIHAWSTENGVDFDVVYTEMARTYNDGYAALGEDRFLRPVLEHVPGPIGGHCVLAGARLIDHPVGDFVLQAARQEERL